MKKFLMLFVAVSISLCGCGETDPSLNIPPVTEEEQSQDEEKDPDENKDPEPDPDKEPDDPYEGCVKVSYCDETVTVTQYINSYVEVEGSTSLTISGVASSSFNKSYVNLKSSYSRIFLPNIKRSEWDSRQLKKYILIDGEPFVDGVNGDVNGYYDHIYISKRDANFSPATIYSGEESAPLDISTIYLGSKIPLGDDQVDRILLKRGHQIVVAASEDGLDSSRCFIAVDNDLEIVLDASLSKRVSFMRVLAVRYVTKRGIGGKSYHKYHKALDLGWYYNWGVNNGMVGTLADKDTDFVPMYWAAGWATEANNKLIIDSQYPLLMAFNEPENKQQSNMTVAQAIELYKGLHKLGVRLASPSCEQVGTSPSGWATGTSQWIHEFMAEVKKQGLRVDIMGFHWYDVGFAKNLKASQTSASAKRLMDNAKACFERYGRPIYITEFNCGTANTYGISSSVNRWLVASGFFEAAVPLLEAANYVERYAMFPPHSAIAAVGTDPDTGLKFAKGLVGTTGGVSVPNVNGLVYIKERSTPSITIADDSAK